MQQDNTTATAAGRTRRTVNELVMAEMFVIQATLESAAAISDGVSDLGRQIRQGQDENGESVAELLQRIRERAVEPYTTRYRYFREMIGSDD
ncbi:MAG: hypothetical protein R3228_06380 [Halioglobus sp.]|nr:hypothetical protein [Halioglobus sp.]